MRRDWKAELASDASTEERYLHPRGLRHPRGAGGRRRHGDAVPRTQWSRSRPSREGERRISHPGCRRAPGPRRVSARKGFAARSGAVRRGEVAPALSRSAGFKSDAAVPESRSLDPWQLHAAAAAISREMLVPPEEGEGSTRWDPGLQHRFAPAEGAPGNPTARQAGRAVTRTATVSPVPFGGTRVRPPPGRPAAAEQTGRREGAAQQAHASDMCRAQLRQTAGSGSLNAWKQHFSVSHFTKPQTITVCRCTGA